MADTPLHEAVRYSDLDEVINALKDGYDPNELGAYQWTPLHEACNNGDTEIVCLLLQYKGDPDVKDSLRGCTAVHYAASQAHVECLKLLIAAGARCDTVNSDGQTALDMSAGECRELLQAEYGKNIYNCQISDLLKQKHSENASISSGNPSCCKSDDENYLFGSGSKDVSDSHQDLDLISLDSGGSSFSHQRTTSWGSGEVIRLNNNQVLGKIQLSFEYNAKKSTLKIRVWKVTELLMPPPETSMIHSIYVKSYLLPDKKKETKRKTEEIRVEPKPPKSNDKVLKGVNEIFTPSDFSFSKSLEYKTINSSMISSHEVLLSVCITQKYTHRSFTIATWTMSLKNAIKRVLKEKYSLKACISTAIPEHMKVYNASELDLAKARPFGSNPSLICKSSMKWTETWQERSVSDSDLNNVRVDGCSDKMSSIEITFPEPADLELEDALQQIMVMEKPDAVKEIISSSAMVNLDVPDEEAHGKYALGSSNHDDSDDSSIEGVKIEQNIELSHVEIHIPNTQEGGMPKSSDVQVSVQRPETPTWDYYSEDPDFSTVVVSAESSNDPSSVTLPMATTFDLPKIHSSCISNPHNEVSTTVDIPKLSLSTDGKCHHHHHHTYPVSGNEYTS